MLMHGDVIKIFQLKNYYQDTLSPPPSPLHLLFIFTYYVEYLRIEIDRGRNREEGRERDKEEGRERMCLFVCDCSYANQEDMKI